MAEKLTDPSKPVHEIIEVLEDGDAIRNDGVRLTAANKNPWYVLATIYGEQEESGPSKIEEQNRSVWNLWSEGRLREDYLASVRELFDKRFENVAAEFPDRKQQVDFSNTYFPTGLNCNGFEFHKTVMFHQSVFRKPASFTSARFYRATNFRQTVFMQSANFNNVFFMESPKGGVCFENTHFNRGAYFRAARFSEAADFVSASFGWEADFNSAKFQSTTRFEEVRFATHVPEFHAAELYDDTVFSCRDQDQENWPPLKGAVQVEGRGARVKVMPAADQKRAYNRLRLFMNKSLQIDEEQFFHRQEMRCKTVLASRYHKPFYWLYALLSDYGNSVWRPLFWMVFVMLSGALFMLWWQEAFTFLPKEASGFDWTLGLLGEDDLCGKLLEATGWSISNTLPFLGFGKLYYGGEFAANLAWPLKVVGGVQTVAGFILLFFFGLGLRNRFRLR